MRADHLLYVDITTRCDVGCEFCMYRPEHNSFQADLVLNAHAMQCLREFFNDAAVDNIIISGEGEPFKNEDVMYDLLGLSGGGRVFQILTSGAWDNKLQRLERLERLAHKCGDQYVLRLSIDRHHLARIPRSHYQEILELCTAGRFGHLSLAVRSLVEDRDLVRSLIHEMLDSLDVRHRIHSPTLLDDDVLLSDGRIPVTYKSTVYPGRADVLDPFPLVEYVHALERKHGRAFTLGNLRARGDQTGLDIAIKPDGRVFFYGAEFRPFGNVLYDSIDFDMLAQSVDEHPWLRTLYTRPFLTLLEEFTREAEAARLIHAVNNPYWIVRSLYPQWSTLLDDVLGCPGRFA